LIAGTPLLFARAGIDGIIVFGIDCKCFIAFVALETGIRLACVHRPLNWHVPFHIGHFSPLVTGVNF
jgi:hypothetical protein